MLNSTKFETTRLVSYRILILVYEDSQVTNNLERHNRAKDVRNNANVIKIEWMKKKKKTKIKEIFKFHNIRLTTI